ncbi:MAG: DUF2283 domain-containing protein [Chroococcidiopsidaceae cyanobacterium CP_BM_ER_R8_30]|nr:DUF2283 domain-containing protein [Chroococcidiopsidaceae cyanobacterium CP_BM_ER_R8_30]
MKVQYFSDTDTLYISLSDAKIANTDMITDNLIIDFDVEERVVSITIEQASGTTDLAKLEAINVATPTLIAVGEREKISEL